MTALAVDTARVFPTASFERFHDYEVGAVKVWEGSFLGEATGFVRALSSGDQFRGIARRTVDNSAGSAGDKKAWVQTDGYVVLTIATATRASIGLPVFITTDNDVSLTKTADDALLGYIIDAAGTTCVIEFHANQPAAKIADATGGSVIDIEGRAALNALIAACEGKAIIFPN